MRSFNVGHTPETPLGTAEPPSARDGGRSGAGGPPLNHGVDPGTPGLFADAVGGDTDRLTRAAAWSVLFLGLITVTGAAVRLTGSGLGCSDWPNCTESSFAAPWEFHAWVEFGNRLVTGLVAIPVLITMFLAIRRRNGRPEVVVWALGVGALTLANALVGAVTVRYELTPPIVMTHFLLSMATIATAVWCHDRARRGPSSIRTPAWGTLERRVAWLAAAVGAAVLTTGTVVTGAGPHGGDPEADRLDLTVRSVARTHSLTMWLLGALVLFLAWRLTRRRAEGSDMAGRAGLPREVLHLIQAISFQGVVGYSQFLLGVPPWLVAVHVAGAVVVWWHLLQLPLASRAALRDRMTP